MSAVVRFLSEALAETEAKLERHHARAMNAFRWHSLKADMEEERFVIRKLLRRARRAARGKGKVR